MDKSIPTFGDFRDVCLNTAEIVVLPVPFDKTATWQKGAKNGPQAILQASSHLEFYDIETDTEVYQKGIFTEKPVISENSEQMISSVNKRVSEILDRQQFPILLGGDHSVSIGAVGATAETHKTLSVLQLDAHADLRDTYMGSKFNHACVMSRIKELCPFVQVGIRSMDVEEKKEIDPNRTFFAHQIIGSTGWISEVVAKLSDTVYVTIDLDVFDIGIVPSTGTPEPGGLDWYLVLRLLKEVAEQKNVIGFDVVELCPSPNKAPDFLAAKLIYKFLSYIWRKKWEEY